VWAKLYTLCFRLEDVPALLLLLICAGSLRAESHPTWWTYASPEATALVGIQWDALRHSMLADAVGGELEASGSLRFPDLACVRDAHQIVISSPALLAMVTGNFPAAMVREQAARAGLKPATYRGVTLWIHPDKETLSVAAISDALLLLGSRRTLESALDRTQPDAPRHYSPLLARAARFAQNADLWVVATRLPDPLANLFVPIESETQGFEGLLQVRNGLYLDAVLEAGSEPGALALAESLRGSMASLPAAVRGMQITADKTSVRLSLELSRAQVASGMRAPETPATAPIPQTAPVPPVTMPVQVAVATLALVPAPAAAEPVEGPQVIRIVGLDEGPREIVLPPVKKQ
jgi:hypothetical protein